MRRQPMIVALAALLALAGSDAEAQKLYRWVDKDGKVHYSDKVPPEAVQQERETLNESGMTTSRIDRAPTPEELAEQARIEAEQAREALAKEEQDKLDAVLLASYQSEADLQRSYDERFELLEQTLESARIGIGSQQKSLVTLLDHAADLERTGKPVGEKVLDSVATARKQVLQQTDFLRRREVEKAQLQAEFDSILTRYRALKSASGSA